MIAVLALAGSAIAGVACGSRGHETVSVTRNECATCHMTEYTEAKQPLHVGNFPRTCSDCHAESGWMPAKGFDHGKYFALDGAHALAACGQCHTTGFNRGDTPKDCVGCHRDDYDSSPFPGHQTFSTTCTDCHDTVAWKPARIADHDQFFKLDGKHLEVACASCHTQGYAAGDTPKDCVGCHRADYDASPYPGHNTFPTTCNNCHMTSAWKPASGSHPESKFPIKSGPHKVVSCMDCHNESLGVNGRDNADCVGCHTGQHSRARMDSKHREVRNYPSGDAAPNFCLSCHSNGRE